MLCLTIYYISIIVISLNTVDSMECDPMVWITTLWFSESISPLFETDDVIVLQNRIKFTIDYGIVS